MYALVLAAVFVWAAAAKLARRDQTAASFDALRVPASGVLARLVPLVELLLAVGLIALPPVGGAAALVLLAAFSAVILRAIVSGVRPPCSCFGSGRTDPVSGVDVLRNILLAGLATAAIFTPEPAVPKTSEGAAALGVCLVGAGIVAAARGPQS